MSDPKPYSATARQARSLSDRPRAKPEWRENPQTTTARQAAGLLDGRQADDQDDET